MKGWYFKCLLKSFRKEWLQKKLESQNYVMVVTLKKHMNRIILREVKKHNIQAVLWGCFLFRLNLTVQD
jgi:hypothetical protein